MTNIIFFGPPGAGKGTQAKLISELYNLSHLSTGEILRKKILEEDTLAKELKEIMSSGKLVSDDILNSIVAARLANENQKGFILDGYPRSLKQSHFLNDFLNKSSLQINYIFNINLNYDILRKRIVKRSSLESRDDDKINVIETRYNEYLKTTEKVSKFYKESSPEIYFEIDGSFNIDEITKNIVEIIKNS